LSDAGDERIVGQFSNYNEMMSALRARAAELNLSGETIDEFSGLPSRYTQKLLGPHQIRKLGAISLGAFLGALAVRGVLVEDRAALERLRRQTTPRQAQYARSAAWQVTLTRRFLQKIGKLGGQANMAKLTAEQRSELGRIGAAARIDNSTKQQRREWARRAAIARWRKP
jgi:hypothetical protein